MNTSDTADTSVPQAVTVPRPCPTCGTCPTCGRGTHGAYADWTYRPAVMPYYGPAQPPKHTTAAKG